MNTLLAKRLRDTVQRPRSVPRGLARPRPMGGAELPLLDRLHAAFNGMKRK